MPIIAFPTRQFHGGLQRDLSPVESATGPLRVRGRPCYNIDLP
ncbi:hypothetical protein OJF2_16590 [Aquisphaera giovannonii]|uniref:Uncharacterized protein n=1 Tax=Aquisphaera giovannonii TaxID=406548 RepID=A0A5B9VXY5_9BACT|nr:hypothetical protein OJF2_16590 [Aquisphaera giovannonii]